MSRTSSFSFRGGPQPVQRPAGPVQRPSVSSRLSFAISNPDHGDQSANPAEHAIEEEIAEIKRYEVSLAVVWLQNASRKALLRLSPTLNSC